MDKETFTTQVRAAELTLYRTAKSILHSDADCEDAVQSAILIAFSKLDTLRKIEYFKTWLVRILIHEAYRIARSNKRTVPLEDTYIAAESAAENSDLTYAIDALPTKLRVAVVLHYIEGYTVAEVAQLCHVPQGTVKSRLARGRKALKSMLEEEVSHEQALLPNAE